MREKILWKIFVTRPKYAKSFSSEKNFYTTFSNGFSTVEWQLSLNVKLLLKRAWQVMLHDHAEAGDVKSTYKGFD